MRGHVPTVFTSPHVHTKHDVTTLASIHTFTHSQAASVLSPHVTIAAVSYVVQLAGGLPDALMEDLPQTPHTAYILYLSLKEFKSFSTFISEQ